MDSPMDGQEIVNRMHEELKKEITPITYDAFISVLKFESIEGNHITFKCDYKYEKEKGLVLSFETIDKIIENVKTVALRRFWNNG